MFWPNPAVLGSINAFLECQGPGISTNKLTIIEFPGSVVKAGSERNDFESCEWEYHPDTHDRVERQCYAEANATQHANDDLISAPVGRAIRRNNDLEVFPRFASDFDHQPTVKRESLTVFKIDNEYVSISWRRLGKRPVPYLVGEVIIEPCAKVDEGLALRVCDHRFLNAGFLCSLEKLKQCVVEFIPKANIATDDQVKFRKNFGWRNLGLNWRRKIS